MATETAFSRLSPFFWTGVAWGALGLVACYVIERPAFMAAIWTLGFWIACMADLYAIARLVMALIRLSSADDSTAKAVWTGQAMIWSVAKIAMLGILGAMVFFGRSAPSVSVIVGLSTLVAVPLVGGIWWSHKETKYA